MTTRPGRLVRFGPFELDLETGELRKGGAKVALQEQPFQVLAMLLERPGGLVTREELRRRLWPDAVFVDFDHGLNKAVAKIRGALGDLAQSPRFVETLERRGYRFVAQIEGPASESPVAGPAAGTAPTIPPSFAARLVWDDRVVPLAPGEYVLGRDPSCSVWIDSEFASRRHARLVVDSGLVVLEDLGSRNGTFVNGEALTTQRQLAHRDEIRIGPARLVLHLAPAGATLTDVR
jgi:DNA-binding winged helix-turn-helix (wHTH) protein